MRKVGVGFNYLRVHGRRRQDPTELWSMMRRMTRLNPRAKYTWARRGVAHSTVETMRLYRTDKC